MVSGSRLRQAGREPAADLVMNKPIARPASGGSSDGFIIIAVLWILGALATLATVYSIYVINTASALAINDDRLKAEALVSAGVELTAYQLTATPDVPPSGSFRFRLGKPMSPWNSVRNSLA